MEQDFEKYILKGIFEFRKDIPTKFPYKLNAPYDLYSTSKIYSDNGETSQIVIKKEDWDLILPLEGANLRLRLHNPDFHLQPFYLVNWPVSMQSLANLSKISGREEQERVSKLIDIQNTILLEVIERFQIEGP